MTVIFVKFIRVNYSNVDSVYNVSKIIKKKKIHIVYPCKTKIGTDVMKTNYVLRFLAKNTYTFLYHVNFFNPGYSDFP